MLTDLKQAPSKSAIPVQDTAGGLQLTVLSLSGVERTELPSQDSDYSFERERALTKNTPGFGLITTSFLSLSNILNGAKVLPSNM